MPRLVNAVKAGLWSKLAGDATLTTLLGGTAIYDGLAPLGTAPPYVVYQQQSGAPDYSLGGHVWDDSLYTIRAVTEGPSVKSAGEIAERVDAVLEDAALTISGGTACYLRRVEDLEYPETLDGRRVNHLGAIYRLIVR